jgi:hypothetical protein
VGGNGLQNGEYRLYFQGTPPVLRSGDAAPHTRDGSEIR